MSPIRPLRLCSKCKKPHADVRCPICEQERKRKADLRRGSSYSRGYDSRWQKIRGKHLKDYPLCVSCLNNGHITQAVVVDHIVPHKGDYDLFISSSNHQSLCASCHSAKTAREDGGFGNSGKSSKS